VPSPKYPTPEPESRREIEGEKNEEKLGGFAFREDLPSSFFLETKKGRG
jgi:hypothetical protein